MENSKTFLIWQTMYYEITSSRPTLKMTFSGCVKNYCSLIKAKVEGGSMALLLHWNKHLTTVQLKIEKSNQNYFIYLLGTL